MLDSNLSAPWGIVYVIATQLDILARDMRSITLFVEFKHIGSHRRETDVGPRSIDPLVHCLCNCNATRHPSKRYTVGHIVSRVQTYWIASERDKCWTPALLHEFQKLHFIFPPVLSLSLNCFILKLLQSISCNLQYTLKRNSSPTLQLHNPLGEALYVVW